MNNKVKVIAGVVLIVVAIVAIVASQPLYREADMVYWNVDMERGEQMYMTANIIKYGGFGAGAVGAILLLVGLLKKSE